MKHTEDQIKKIIAKVYKDLKLDHNDQYPIKLIF